MRKRALIAGGGIAGLAAAKVLSRYFSEVIILEGNEPAQSHHLHVLLKAGQESLERIFPGITSKLETSGCPHIDWAQDTKWETNSGFFPRYQSEVRILSMSRKLLNDKLKKELNVKILKEQLIGFDEKAAYTCLDNKFEYDYLVLATGANFPLKRFIPVETKSLDINLTYRSFLFDSIDLHMEGFKQYYFQMDPPFTTMGAVISPVEEGKTIVTLIEKEESLSRCETLADFKLRARAIPGDPVSKILGNALPVSPLKTFHKKKTTKNSFNFQKLPQNLILLGDLHASLNPVFGQGMSLALKQVEVLAQEFEKGFESHRFHQKVKRLNRFPYFLSLFGSLENGLGKTILRAYLKLCQRNSKLHHGFLTTLHSLGRAS